MRKNMKKVMALALAASMTLGMTTAFAAQGTNADTGKITINDAIKGQTYEIYQILTLESYNTDSEAYAYKAVDRWAEFVESKMNVDDRGYVTWKDGTDVVAFAKEALVYADENGIEPTKEAVKATSETVTFESLNLGYYLLDTTTGALCSLDTTATEVEIAEKNELPDAVKKIQEDSDNAWGNMDHADIGQVVNYKTTVTVQYGAENYILHDKMSNGLTFNNDIAIDGLTENTHYTVVTDTDDGCTFHIVFDKENFLDTIKNETNYEVTYSATLNENAMIFTNENKVANTNDTRLEFGNGNFTEWDHTDTFSFKFDVFKYTTHEQTEEVGLAGAEFKLYADAANENQIHLVEVEEGKKYRVCADENCEEAAHLDAMVTSGEKMSIEGLDEDTYYLVETVAPDGYNLLSKPVEITIEANIDTEDGIGEDDTVSVSVQYDDTESMTANAGVVKVENKSGTELPSTGGIGTTIFYVLGGLLVAFSGVVLFAKKRMSGEV